MRELQLWPAPGDARTEGEFFDDDGESHGWRQGNALWMRWALRSSSDRLELTLEKRGDYQPAWREIEVLLPAGERRELWINGEKGGRFSL